MRMHLYSIPKKTPKAFTTNTNYFYDSRRLRIKWRSILHVACLGIYNFMYVNKWLTITIKIIYCRSNNLKQNHEMYIIFKVYVVFHLKFKSYSVKPMIEKKMNLSGQWSWQWAHGGCHRSTGDNFLIPTLSV